jgi:hypothetical protein
MQLIIEELKNTACSIDSSDKQSKTIETLNAISGMLESLKNNHILSPAKPRRQDTNDMELRSKFESLICTLKVEFNSMLEARKIIKE